MADGNVPEPVSERAPWVLAIALLLIGAGTLAAVISGAVGRARPAPPPLVLRAATPAPAATVTNPATGRRKYVSNTAPAHAPKIVAHPPLSARRPLSKRRPLSAQLSLSGSSGLQVPVTARWMSGFYPIYEQAQKAFGVNWLLIASIHRQESAFSTAPSTYHGLNFAGCCGGPMQFNVTNGPVTTWAKVADSYRYGHRPAVYDHRTARHPSIYDDFDSIMAAAHLLSLDGATYSLNDSAWWAAYDYYGHDEFGITYADEVLARAIGWSQHGFCASCGTSASLVSAVHAAYGAPVLATLRAQSRREALAKARAKTKAARTAYRDRIRRRAAHSGRRG